MTLSRLQFEIAEPARTVAGQGQSDDDRMGGLRYVDLGRVPAPVRRPHRPAGHADRGRHRRWRPFGPDLDVELRAGPRALHLRPHGPAKTKPLATPSLSGERLFQPACPPAPWRGRAREVHATP